MAVGTSLEDLIFVQDKIVTYKNASKQLNVHINTAKQLLHSFVSNPEVKEKVVATHIIAGFTKDKNHSVALVKSEDLERAKQKFECITSQHVYSVQKSTESPSSNSLYMADSSHLPEGKKFCSIECGKKDILKVLEKPVSHPAPTPEPPKKQNVFLNSTANKKPTENTQKSSESEGKNQRAPPAKAKREENKSSKPDKTKEPARGIGSFFTNGRVSSKEPPKNQATEGKKRALEEDSKNHKDNSDSLKNKPQKKGESKKPRNNKKQKLSHDEPKKRRRIVIDSDSDSEEPEEEEEEEQMEVDIPPPEIPSPVKEKESPDTNSKKRIRKGIDRTFVDDDGFIITKKDYVYESCSDDEAEKPEKKVPRQEEKPAPVNPPKKVEEAKPSGGKKSKVKASPSKNKQASIKSFFCKK